MHPARRVLRTALSILCKLLSSVVVCTLYICHRLSSLSVDNSIVFIFLFICHTSHIYINGVLLLFYRHAFQYLFLYFYAKVQDYCDSDYPSTVDSNLDNFLMCFNCIFFRCVNFVHLGMVMSLSIMRPLLLAPIRIYFIPIICHILFHKLFVYFSCLAFQILCQYDCPSAV